MQNSEQHQPEQASRHGSGYAGLDHPESAWNRAAARATQGDAFCCRTEWQLSFHETFRSERKLLLQQDRGSVIAFAERQSVRHGPMLEPVESSWLFGCPLLGDDAVDLLDAHLLARAADAKQPDVLISGLLAGGPVARRVAAQFGTRYQIFVLNPDTMCSASLAGGFDGYLSRRTGRLRRNLRQQARRANDDGVTFERHTPASAAAAAAVYRRMLDVEARSWKGIGRCGMAESPSREFYAVMLRRLAVSGSGRVVFARCGDADIGFIFGGLAGNAYRGQQFSYVEDWRRASIGNLLQLEQLRWLCEEGVERYDMGPQMDYKRHWTELETRIDTWLLRPVR